MSLSPELTVFLTAMTPIGELRAALPLALLVYKMAWFKAYILSVAGNIAPIFLWWLFLKYVYKILAIRFKKVNVFFNWFFARTRNRFSRKYEKWGKMALVIFVAIPLPITGAWTGATAAWLFGFKYAESMWLVSLGVLIAGLVVSLITLSGVGLVN